MDDNNNEIVDMINKLVDSGIINNPESVKILTDYHIKMTEALTEKEKVEVEKKKIFRDELESMFNFGVNLIDRGVSIIERHNEIADVARLHNGTADILNPDQKDIEQSQQ